MPSAEDLHSIDELIRSGNFTRARHLFLDVTKRKNKRDELVTLASFARRLNLADVGLKILFPIFRTTLRNPQEPSDAEKAEYGALLARVGALDEAEALLSKLSVRKNPDVLLFRASVHVSRWDYAGAISLYRHFLKLPSTNYKKRIVRVNLAAALVHERQFLQADSLLRELIPEVARAGQKFLHSVLMELGAQTLVGRNKYAEAVAYLDKARENLTDSHTREELYTKKWRAIATLGLNPTSSAARKEIEAVREIARAQRNPETLRDLDFWEGLLRKDERLLAKVYFGTPFEKYREALLREVGEWEVPKTFDWVFGEAKGALVDYAKVIEDPRFTPATREIIYILASDFYRPISTVELHSRLFPQEHYNPISSPSRIHQNVRRLRLILSSRKTKLTISHEDEGYRLGCRAGVLRVPLSRTPRSRGSSQLETLRETFGAKFFNVGDAKRVLKIPHRSAQRLLGESTTSGALEKSGAGSSTKYRFVKNS